MSQNLSELEARLTDACSDWKLYEVKDSFFWFISDGKEVVGTASLQNINRMMLTAEIGYGVFADYRERGIATQIVHKLTTDTFQNSNLRKLIAFVHEQNIASRSVLEKSGYIKEGLLREHYLVNTLPVNEVIYGILRKDIG